MKTRRGFSLVELLVVMSAASTVLTLSATLIHQAMRAHTKAQSIHADERTAWRLSARFRRDVRGSIDATLASDGQTPGTGTIDLTLQRPSGGPTRYRFDGPLVTRIAQQDGATQRDEFAFVGGVAWSLSGADPSRRLVLTTDPVSRVPVTADLVAPVRLHVEARLQREAVE